MDGKTYLRAKRIFLTWLATTTVLLAVIAFSGHSSEPGRSGVAKTELIETNRFESGTIICFHTLGAAGRPALQLLVRIPNFRPCLLVYEGSVKVEITTAAKQFTDIDKRKKNLFNFYSSNYSREIGSNLPRG